VHQTDLQILFFDLCDMHRPSLKMGEYMEFQIGLSVKEFVEFFLSPLNLITFSCYSTFETISF
jgi:hypothetical protein